MMLIVISAFGVKTIWKICTVAHFLFLWWKLFFSIVLQYIFYCIGASGPNCDLRCESSSQQSSVRKCTNVNTNVQYSCNVTNNEQNWNCIECLEFANNTCTKPANGTQPIVSLDNGKVGYYNADYFLKKQFF